MKSIKLFSFLLISFVIFSLLLIGYKIFSHSSPNIPFIYGLKTQKIQPVDYLPENNSTVLEADHYTVGIYSVRKEHFFLQEIFQTAGIPYIVGDHIEELNATHILFLDFDIDLPQTLTPAEKKFLYDYVSRGGIVIGNEILPTRYGVLKELFGYKSYHPTRSHHLFRLGNSKYYTYFNTPQEQTYRLSTIDPAPYTNSIETGTAIPIAYYEDNTTAISLNHYHKGIAINLGISLFDLRYRNLFGKDFHANTAYINHFEPLSDFIVLFIKGIYESVFPKSVTLHSAKDGNQATVIMTHDVDFDASIKNIPKFTALEEKLGFRATYNIQTKYITDDKDKAFFTPQNFHYILDAQANGHEIGSHTILHTKNFFLLPKGDCHESYPQYKPFSMSEFVDSGNPTACGELKVPKELLLGIGVNRINSFRSGELLYHPDLPGLLERFGYRYSSCFSAEDVLSYFPYRYMHNYKTLSSPSKIWEIPLVLEDELFPPMYFRVEDALVLFQKLYDNGAVFTILDHPDLTLYRLKHLDLGFIEKFYTQLPNDVWKATMNEVGDFWDKRDKIVFRYRLEENTLHLTIYSPSDISGLTFKLQGMRPKPGAPYRIIQDKLVIDISKGVNRWHIALY
jgi:hypothetical protein